ncbi:MAG: rhodanese-like domain-containing protein, partial [Acidobacteriota bacterium]
LAAMTAVFLILIAGVIVSTSLFMRAEAARLEAVRAQELAVAARRAEEEQRNLAEDRFFALPENISVITPQEAKRLLDQNTSYLYLDVRTVPGFASGHVPGAFNIPVALRDLTTQQMKMNKRFLAIVRNIIPTDAHVIVGCRSGRRSARATRIMLLAGYKHAYSMDGGFVAKKDETGRVLTAGWSGLGYPVQDGEGGDRSYSALLARRPVKGVRRD